MEYVSGGELFDYICKHGRVSASPGQPRHWVGRGWCSGVEWLLKGAQLRLRPKIEVASQQSHPGCLVPACKNFCVIFCSVLWCVFHPQTKISKVTCCLGQIFGKLAYFLWFLAMGCLSKPPQISRKFMAWEGKSTWCGLCPSHSSLPNPPRLHARFFEGFSRMWLIWTTFSDASSPSGYKSPEEWAGPVKCEILVTRKIIGVCPVEGKEVKMGQSGHPE